MEPVIDPQSVDSVDVPKVAKKGGKARRFANKLRSSFHLKSPESVTGLGVGEGTPSFKREGKLNSAINVKKSLEKRVTSSLEKLKKKLNRSEGRAPLNDNIDVSEDRNEISVEEVVTEGINPAHRMEAIVLEVDPDADLAQHDLLFPAQDNGELVREATEEEDSDSSTHRSTPHARDDEAPESFDQLDSEIDELEEHVVTHCGVFRGLSDVADPTTEKSIDRILNDAKVPEFVHKQVLEIVKTPGGTVGTVSNGAKSLDEESSDAGESVWETSEKASDRVQDSEGPLEKAEELQSVEERLQKTPEISEPEVEAIDDVVVKVSETFEKLVQIDGPTEPLESNVATHEESSHVVPLEADVVEKGSCTWEIFEDGKASDAPTVEGDVTEEEPTFRPRAINTAGLDFGDDAEDQACAIEDAAVTPKKNKRTLPWTVNVRLKELVRGKAGIVVSAALLLAKLFNRNT